MSESKIRPGAPSDEDQLARLRAALWPESSADEHARELGPILAGKPPSTLPYAVFVAEMESGVLAGFLEAGLRSHADGCDTRRPVGFVEGWFVREHARRKGLGKRLLAAAEDWARSQGCTEMASDTWIDSTLSQHVHESLNFEVVDRCIHYRKAL